MNKKLLTGALALGAIFMLGANYVQADQSRQGQKDGRGQKDEMLEMRQNGNMGQMKQRFENRPELTDVQRDELKQLRETGDRAAIHDKLQEFGISPRGPQGLFLGKLTEVQRDEIKDLQADGDRDAISDKLDEWGIERPENKNIETLKNTLSSDDFNELEQAHETIQKIMEKNKKN